MTDNNGMTYIRMLIDVLEKKEVHLTNLLNFTTEQEKLLQEEEFKEAEFSVLMEKKSGNLRKLEEIDSGFQSLYNRVADEMKENKEQYKEQILAMQKLISKVTDLGVKLTALENKNRATLEAKLQGKKQNIRQFKVSRQTADKYYKNMIGMQTGASYFMDKKQ